MSQNRLVNPELVKNLNPKELELWEMIQTRTMTLMLHGNVGESKSAILCSIAKKLDMYYIRMDLATKDETELGEYPSKAISPQGYNYVEKLLPHFVVECLNSEKPVLLVFEEPNRCNDYTRAAALGILNEKVVANIQLPEHVFFAGAMNLGEDYESEVTDLGKATKNRCIWYKYELTPNEWFEYYADKNLETYTLEFLKSNPNQITFVEGSIKDDSILAFNTKRSWTGLSEYLKQFTDNIDLLISKLKSNGHRYIGSSASNVFIEYLETKRKIGYLDILNNYEKIKPELDELTKIQKFNYIKDFEHIDKNVFDLNVLTDKQYKNLESFMFDQIKERDIIIGFIKSATKITRENAGFTSKDGDRSKLVFIEQCLKKQPRFKQLNEQVRKESLNNTLIIPTTN